MPARSITLEIVNPLGLHARPAAQLAKLAGQAKGGVWIRKADETANAASMLDMLMLACAKGTEITLSIEDAADLDALEQMAELVRCGFGEV